MKYKLKLKPSTVILIAGIIALIMFTSSFIELNQSRKEMFQLLYEHSSALIESIIQSSDNTLNSSFEIEDLITDRLLNNARLIKQLDNFKSLTKSDLIKIADENDLYRINIFDKNGNRILTNRIPEPDHPHGDENINRSEELYPILNGDTDEIVIGLKPAQFIEGERFAVAVARTNNRGAIIVNIDAQNFLEFRKKIGVGKILQEMTKHRGIEYIVLQDTIGILAASERIDTIEAIKGSGFLMTALLTDSTYSRLTTFSSTEIYEVVKSFKMQEEIIGLYRIGLSLEDVRNVEARVMRRLIIISIILAAISVIVLSIIFTTQNLKAISEEYRKFKTLASSVLENMGEAVIVLDKNKNITLFNKSAENLFNMGSEDVLLTNIFGLQNNILELSDLNFSKGSVTEKYFEREIILNNNTKFLLLSLSGLTETNDQEKSYIIVIKDMTELKQLEKEARKNEKLTAMGELASGVAHEIRNPINAIGMIAQRLNKEFEVTSNNSEFNEITGLLRSEVNRINKIINQFLSYAKPLDIKPAVVDLKKFFKDINHLFEEQARQKNINFIVKGDDTLSFIFDADLIKQALMNIIQNAFDAVNENANVSLTYSSFSSSLNIEIKDNGKGIPDDVQKRIFDLYYTTKKDGNGLGLSIAQKIVAQHNGFIQLSSSLNKGTTFKIILPKL